MAGFLSRCRLTAYRGLVAETRVASTIRSKNSPSWPSRFCSFLMSARRTRFSSASRADFSTSGASGSSPGVSNGVTLRRRLISALKSASLCILIVRVFGLIPWAFAI